jgi:hypothetical protein
MYIAPTHTIRTSALEFETNTAKHAVGAVH